MLMKGLVILVVLVAACDSTKSSHESKPPAAAERAAPMPPPPIDADVAQEVADELERNIPVVDVTLAKLAADYRTNEIAADDKYKEQVLRFRAPIHRITKDGGGPILELQVGTQHTFVRARFASGDGLAALRPGQETVVHCFCEGFVGGRLALNSCALETGRASGLGSAPAPK